MKLFKVFDSDFTFHYEIEGPDELAKFQRNIRKSVGPRCQENESMNRKAGAKAPFPRQKMEGSDAEAGEKTSGLFR